MLQIESRPTHWCEGLTWAKNEIQADVELSWCGGVGWYIRITDSKAHAFRDLWPIQFCPFCGVHLATEGQDTLTTEHAPSHLATS